MISGNFGLRGRRVVVFQDWGVGFDALERSATSMLSLILLFAAFNVFSKVADIYGASASPSTTAPITTAAPLPASSTSSSNTFASSVASSAAASTSAAPSNNGSFPSSTHSDVPISTSSPFVTSSPPLVPVASVPPASRIPIWIVAGAAATSGHVPRALELVQFLSIYCTSLSSRQQTRVSEFQVASFTHITSKLEYCGVCPGSCSQPLVLVMPTFAVMSCLLALGLLVTAFDAYKSRILGRVAPPVPDHLLDTSATSTAAATDGHPSLLRTITSFCNQYLRSLIETCSAYVLMPCTFVFVLNLRPSLFSQAGSSDRAMIVMLPVLTLLFRALVIRQRVVQLSPTDQQQLYVGSASSCFISAVLSVYFDEGRDAHQSAPLFESDASPQYIVLALIVTQVIIQTVIRLRATEASIFDNVDWPWSSDSSLASSAVFSFDQLAMRLVVGSIKRSWSAAISAGAKFFLLNHVAVSQVAMVVSGLASARATSASSIEASSVVIGSIPLITSGVLLLHNLTKFIFFLWRKWCRRPEQTSRRRSSDDSVY